MRKEKLVQNTLLAIMKIILFLFQRMIVRSATNNRAAAKGEVREGEFGHDPGLTIYRSRSVEADNVDDHGQECGYASQGVYPYSPPVGATPLDDTPFVVKGSEKLPDE